MHPNYLAEMSMFENAREDALEMEHLLEKAVFRTVKAFPFQFSNSRFVALCKNLVISFKIPGSIGQSCTLVHLISFPNFDTFYALVHRKQFLFFKCGGCTKDF